MSLDKWIHPCNQHSNQDIKKNFSITPETSVVHLCSHFLLPPSQATTDLISITIDKFFLFQNTLKVAS